MWGLLVWFWCEGSVQLYRRRWLTCSTNDSYSYNGNGNGWMEMLKPPKHKVVSSFHYTCLVCLFHKNFVTFDCLITCMLEKQDTSTVKHRYIEVKLVIMYASDSVLDRSRKNYNVYMYHMCLYMVESVGEVRTFIQ